MKHDAMNDVITGSLVAMGLIVSTTAASPVTLNVTKDGASLGNDFVSVFFDLAKSSYTVIDRASGEVVLADAGVTPLADDIEFSPLAVESQEDVTDIFGKGKRLVLRLNTAGFRSQPDVAHLYSFTLYENEPAIIMGFGMKSPPWHRSRLMEAYPMAHAHLFPGKAIAEPLTLNGSAGSEPASVKPGISRSSPNSLMLTGLVDGKRRTIVWGGLGYDEFGKYAAVRNGRLEMKASDPVGRLVDDEQTYFPKDTFYLDVVTAEPFAALEKYGRAMRAANHAKPNVYDFPVLCGWSVGHISKLPGINNSQKLVGELEAAQKAGLTQYTKVGIRLEPDKYNGDTEQGWWDDAHWAQYGHLVPPYDTFAKWCAAIRERDGVPYTYFQVGMPSDDYAKAFPGHMLFNDISKLGPKHSHHRPLVSFDYTDPDFQKHMQEVWARLRRDGIRGIKFDYPETGWRPEGGFENRHATAAFAYREAFRLCREGLGADAFIDERNLGESGRPCLEVTAGIVDTQRNWTDSNAFVPGMITIGGLRWYKNRTVFNYFPDTKTVHGCSPGIRQSMLTMVYLTSGRIDLATSFTLFTPEIVRDFSRIYPAYREPFTARPLDAFTGVADPQVYDLELTPDWHQVALFNTSTRPGPVVVALSGERITNAIGLDPKGQYYAYEFWTDTFLGKLPGTARLERTLEPSHCAMIGLRKVQPHPQVLSTDRHLLQGWLELEQVQWDAAPRRLSGIAKVIGGEPFKLVVANNGLKPLQATAQDGSARLAQAASPELSAIVLERPANGNVAWQIEYNK
jgi:hypothetical protein